MGALAVSLHHPVVQKLTAGTSRRLRDIVRLAVNPQSPQELAKKVGLRYVEDTTPGFSRIKTRSGFRFFDANGHSIRNPAQLKRAKHLAIPPAWVDVWICPFDNGHIQATGRDAKGRKQYLYHADWRQHRDANKFEKMIAFGQAISAIRAEVEHDLRLTGLPKEKVLATIVTLLESTHIRIGNDEYAKSNQSYGLTTMRCRHVQVDKASLRFCFKGKSGIRHAISLEDKRIAKIIRSCQELPGQELFQFIGDDGEVHRVGSDDVNSYLREKSGLEITAKDFRTWAATVLAAQELMEIGPHTTSTQAKKQLNAAIETVSKKLGNTKAICRKSYIHPLIVNSYLEGNLLSHFEHVAKGADLTTAGLSSTEQHVLSFLMMKTSASCSK